MGLLSSIGGAVKKAGSTAATGLDYLSTTIAKPVQVATAIVSPTKTVKEVKEQFFSQPLSTQLKQEAIGAVVLVGTAAGGAAIATSSKAASIAASIGKALIPTTPKGVIATAIAAPIVIGAVTKEPAKAVEIAINAPSQLAEFGGDVASFAVNPSIESGKEIFSDSPIISTVATIGIVAGLASKVIPAVLAAKQLEATKEQTAAIREVSTAPSVIPSAVVSTPAPATSSEIPKVASTTASSVPVTPETAPLIASAGTGTTTKKKRKKAKLPASISQKVNVLVSNRANSTGIRLNKRYINREILVN